MYKARFTEVGARQMGLPKSAAGDTFEYDGFTSSGMGVNNIYYKGQRVGATLSHAGDDPGCELITKPKSR